MTVSEINTFVRTGYLGFSHMQGILKTYANGAVGHDYLLHLLAEM